MPINIKDEVSGTYIIELGDDHYVGKITDNRFSKGSFSIQRLSPYSGLHECEEYCFKMGIISKGVINEDELDELKDIGNRAVA